AFLILFYRLSETLGNIIRKKDYKNKSVFSEELTSLSEPEIDEILLKRKKALGYQLSGNELSKDYEVEDSKGLIAKVTHKPNMPLADEKKRTKISLETPEELKKIVIWYLGAAVFWLVFGTFIGQYVGMKF